MASQFKPAIIYGVILLLSFCLLRWVWFVKDKSMLGILLLVPVVLCALPLVYTKLREWATAAWGQRKALAALAKAKEAEEEAKLRGGKKKKKAM